MLRISTRAHGAADYATGALLIAAPALLRPSRRRSGALLRLAGTGMLASAASTDWELGVRRRLPVPLHLKLDAGMGAALLASPFVIRGGARNWLPHVLVGVTEVASAALTERAPQAGAEESPVSSDSPRTGAGDDLPPATPGLTGAETADDSPRGELGTRLATPPIETPGPSVPAPTLPESETERREWADGTVPDSEALGTSDPTETLIAQEEAAAAAEAATIGGPDPAREADDPAMEPVYEAGGGEQEGWEQAEADLIENATHADGHGDPIRDALGPEAEADRSTAIYGDPDDIDVTEVTSDPTEGPDDPGAGPGLAAERDQGAEPQRQREDRG